MSEPINAAPPAASKRERKALGRNQRIAVWGFAAPLVVTLALTILAMLRAADAAPILAQWMGHASSYVPLAMGVVLGGGAIVKSASAVADAVKARKA